MIEMAEKPIGNQGYAQETSLLMCGFGRH